MFQASDSAMGAMTPPRQRSVLPVIGSRFTPGLIYRDPVRGEFYEVMPEVGIHAEMIQTILLADKLVRFRQANRPAWSIRLFQWFFSCKLKGDTL
jgi:hypothetical protein